MSPDHSSRRAGAPVWLVMFGAALGSLLLAIRPAAAQPPGATHLRGQAAIDRLGPRLRGVAARHRIPANRLRELLRSDPYLAVDESHNLLFIDEFLPEEADARADADPRVGADALNLAETFLLHSLPGATKVIYLDFDGHTTTGTSWNSGYGDPLVSEPFSLDGDPAFSDAERTRIQYIWQRVAEDYLPYGVDVTTQDPGVEGLRRLGAGDQAWGQRVVISPTNWYNTNAGGVAYIGSFNWSSDTPCFVFTAQLGNGNEKYAAEAATHEAGHTVGLYHDGVSGGAAYYSGHNGWAPIMGVGYYQSLVQWSKGEYPNANNPEDDLTVMTGYGFSVRPDDHGNTAAAATPLVVTNATNVGGSGIIERPTDKDAFSFSTGAGTIALNVSGAARSANLDIKAELYDSVNVLVASANSSVSLNAAISLYVAAGTYTLLLDGVGNGDLVTGYSDYGSLGEYAITGTIISPGVPQSPVAVAAAAPTSGTVPLPVQFTGSGSYDPDGTIATYAWDFGDGSPGDGSANPAHTYLGKGVFTAALTVTDNAGLTGTATVVITVTGPPAAPASLVASAVSSSQINLGWTDLSDDETGFAIERSPDGLSWAQITAVGANVQTYGNTGLAAGTKYYYRVRAYNAAGSSLYSNVASATTPIPATVHVGDLDASLLARVTITVHDAAHGLVAGAVVTGAWSTGGTASCATSTRGTCTVTVSGLPIGTTNVRFTVTGVDRAGSSYDATANHDPDGDHSDGTSITIRR